MGGHEIAVGVGFFADSPDHFRRHFEFSGHAFFFGVQDPSGDHKLDKIHFLLLRFFQVAEGIWNG